MMEALLREIGINPDEAMLERFNRYLDMLYQANERMNLTRIPREDAFHAHILDTLAPISLDVIPEGSRVLDIGTGAGVPGVPLCIARGDIEAVLIDGTKKKVDFVSEVCASLGLNAMCEHIRAEDLAKDTAFRNAFDVVTARAVAPMEKLVPLCTPFLKNSGLIALYKGPTVHVEMLKTPHLQKNTQIGFKVNAVAYCVPERDWERYIVIIKRV